MSRSSRITLRSSRITSISSAVSSRVSQFVIDSCGGWFWMALVQLGPSPSAHPSTSHPSSCWGWVIVKGWTSVGWASCQDWMIAKGWTLVGWASCQDRVIVKGWTLVVWASCQDQVVAEGWMLVGRESGTNHGRILRDEGVLHYLGHGELDNGQGLHPKGRLTVGQA